MPVAVPPAPVVVDLGDLTLRAPRPSDAEALVAAFADPDLRLWNPPPQHEDGPHAAALAWIRDRCDWSGGIRLAWAVTATATDALLGSVSVRVGSVDDDGSIGYWTTRASRGRGVATRAVRAAAEFAFTEVGLHRIELAHALENPASCRVALAAGFALEGTLRESHTYGDARRHDEHLHARLRTDPA